MLFALYALIDSIPHEFLGGIFPIVISSLLILFGILLSLQLVSKEKQKDVLSVALIENGQFTHSWSAAWKNFLILPVFLLGTWILGFIPSLTVLFVVIIRTKMYASWLKIFIITGSAIGFLVFISNLMTLHLPMGIIGNIFLQG